MGGLDWQALPVVSEMLGFKDVDILIAQLSAIRNHLKQES